jgi:hypothetical protein
MSKDYYQRFRTLLSDTTIDDLLKKTVGYNESIEGINQVNEWVKQNVKPDADFKKFDEIFSSCLNADETLWFNLAWYKGWIAGVAQCLRLIDENEPHSTDGMGIIERNFLSLMNFKPK